ncbi:MAG: PAN/Apple domain-containing protein, partial [Chromatiaceae bacterium]
MSRLCLQLRLAAPIVLSTVLGLVCGFVPSEAAAPPSRQLVLMQDADLAGRDFRILKDVELEACESACLAEPACLAFTYNGRARWCFLKDRFEAPRTSVGAISGRIVEGDARGRAERLSELGFLPAETLSAADALAGGLRALAAGDVADYG